jgi:hypothetical protein
MKECQLARKTVHGPDCWGFAPKGGKETVAMYVMRALEGGRKTKEAISLEYRYDFDKSAGASDKQSTFDTFLSDVVKPFGHASQARSIIILKDPLTGHLSLDPTRVEVSKNAIAKGILRAISKIPGSFPPDINDLNKKDLRAIDAVREEFRVPMK